MAKINYIKINGTIRYLETIAYLSTLPTATSDSADLVSVNNKIYVKNYTTTQGFSGVWQFKDRLTTDLTVAKNITFTTTSDRATIYTQIRGGADDMYYNDTYVYDSADWINAVYKTIIIIGGADIEDSELESFLRTNATYLGRAYYYTELTATSSGGGIEIIDINGVATLPSDYQSIATLETAYLLRNDLFYKLESEDTDYLYFTNNYELAYNRISVNKNDWSITQAETINVDRVFGVEITDVPSTATNGTLTEIQLATLQASDSNYIMFNNEKYYLNDKGHTEGYLTYSHVGAQSDEIYLKTITITISTRGWVLLEQLVNEPQPPITIIEELPTANETEYDKHKLYLNGGKLHYLIEETIEEPNVSSLGIPIALHSAISTQIDNKLYIIGGYTLSGSYATASKKIYEYDLDSGTYTEWENILIKADTSNNVCAIAYGNNIYVICNYTLQKLNTIDKTVTEIGSVDAKSAILCKGKIYGFYYDTLYIADLETDTITTRTLSISGYYYSMSVKDNYIYMFTSYAGSGNGANSYEIRRFNTSNYTFEILGTMEYYLSYSLNITLDNYIYIFGGIRNTTTTNEIIKYDITNNTFQTLTTTLPSTLAFNGSSYVPNNGIYHFISRGGEIAKIEFGTQIIYKTLATE